MGEHVGTHFAWVNTDEFLFSIRAVSTLGPRGGPYDNYMAIC